MLGDCNSFNLSSVASNHIGLEIFSLPQEVIKIIESSCRNFLWTSNVTITKKALISWDKLVCLPKVAGGLNLIDIRVGTKQHCANYCGRCVIIKRNYGSNGFITIMSMVEILAMFLFPLKLLGSLGKSLQ